VLSRVADAIVLEFVSRMTREWLPGRDCQLLYRGSRDGMTPAAFHDKCDERLPTIVLIAGQSDGHPVSVFGGYASKSWKSSRCFVDARDSFLFSMVLCTCPYLTAQQMRTRQCGVMPATARHLAMGITPAGQ
jgi:hypothetical protein